MPNLSSFFPSERPAVGLGTMNAEIPLCLRDLSVVAKTTVASLSYPLVIQDLVPFNFQPPAVVTAVVEAAPASLPLPLINIIIKGFLIMGLHIF